MAGWNGSRWASTDEHQPIAVANKTVANKQKPNKQLSCALQSKDAPQAAWGLLVGFLRFYCAFSAFCALKPSGTGAQAINVANEGKQPRSSAS